MGELTVFKMNECDWVAAESEETAKKFYAKEYKIDWYTVGKEFEGKVSSDEKMWIEANENSIDLLEPPYEFKSFGSEMWAAVTFKWMIKQILEVDGTFPCVIASTEY